MSHDRIDNEVTETGSTSHKAARSMKVVVDDAGCNWLCDTGVDKAGDLVSQGCWRCSDMAFNRNG